jgi:hypothetical protein
MTDRDPGVRKRLGARFGPEPLAATMTVLELILIVLVLAVLVAEFR